MRVGLVPTWWQGDGILGLITNPKDVHAVRRFPDLPLVDLSKGWIADSMPLRLRSMNFEHPARPGSRGLPVNPPPTPSQ